jgi:hypothetical protein
MINMALKSYFNQTITYIYNNYKLVLIQSITEAYYFHEFPLFFPGLFLVYKLSTSPNMIHLKHSLFNESHEAKPKPSSLNEA